MSSLSVDGLISGLDTTTLVNQLMQLEAAPQQRLQTTLKAQNSSVSAYQSIATRLKSVETAIATLSKDATWGARSVAVTGTAATATAAAGAVAGQSTVEVTTLATAATWTSTGALGLDDPLVTADPPTLTVTDAKGDEVVVTPKSGSLRDVMDAINATPESGLTATAVKVGNDQYRLQLRAAETGTAAAPTSVAGFPDGALEAAPAKNAVYTVNGLEGTSSSNTVADLLPGVTVTFAQTGTSTVTVTSDPKTTSTAVKAVVDEVNKVLDEIGRHTLAGANGATRGVLAGDAQARGIATNLLRAVSDAFGDSFSAQVGVQTTKEGRVTFDAAAFTAAYEKDPAAVRALVTPPKAVQPTAPDDGSTPTPVPDPVGIAQRLSAVIAKATDSATGTITTSIQGRERTVKDLQTQIDGWDRRLENRRSILNKQFSGLEVALQRLQTQGGYLASAINSMNAQS